MLFRSMLKNGFARMKVPFPDPNSINKEPDTDSSGAKEESGPSKSEKQILQAYFQGQVQRLTLEANAKNRDIVADKPSKNEIAVAVQTGSLRSEASQVVIAKIKLCYEKLGLTFYAPPMEE
mgnify:CR=1 FL=1